MIKMRNRWLASVACAVTVMAIFALVLPTPAMAAVVAKKPDAAVVQIDTLPTSPQAATVMQLEQMQGEGVFGMAETAIAVAAGVLIAVLIIWALK